MIKGLKIERSNNSNIVLEEPTLMCLTTADLTKISMWDDSIGGYSNDKLQDGIKFQFECKVKEQKIIVFKDCSLKFGRKANLPKVLRGLLTNSTFNKIMTSELDPIKQDQLIENALNACIGKWFLVTTEAKVNKKGYTRNIFASVTPPLSSMTVPSEPLQATDISKKADKEAEKEAEPDLDIDDLPF